MAETKQLVLVVEGTTALGPHWLTIVSDYLEKVIRFFSGSKDTKPSTRNAELNLVIFNAHGPSSYWLVQRSEWTKDVDMFMNWLRAIQFSGDECNYSGYVAIAEGLGEALMMFPEIPGNHNQQNVGLQRHCILVAANNPNPDFTPVYKPAYYRPPFCKTGSHLSDAFTVAISFPQCLVSLSVISPTKLQKLEALYKAAKRTPSTSLDHFNGQNPNYLVLISGCFDEARAALTSPPEITHLPSNPSPKNTRIDLNPEDYDNISKIVTSSAQAESIALDFREAYKSMTLNPDWEGSLYREIQGQREFITKLKAFKIIMGSSDSLLKDLPSTLITKDRLVEDPNYTGKMGHLVFEAKDKHPFLVQLQENKENKQRYALIKLPSWTLLLKGTDRVGWLYGMVFPEEMVASEQTQQGQDASPGQQS